jgi:pyridoxal phosphate enzyme (YggS family)
MARTPARPRASSRLSRNNCVLPSNEPIADQAAAAIAANLADVRHRIDRAARASGRDPAGVRLVAVSKTFGPPLVRAAAAAGHKDFGENRVQEAIDKMASCADLGLTWHLIGHLQSNKARRAAGDFPWIQSIDSVSLLKRVDTAAADQGQHPSLLVQVDFGDEATKHGAAPSEVPKILEAAERCRAARVAGLMILPPYFDDPEQVRPYFRRLRTMAEHLTSSGADPAMLRELSMGMSHDFEVAVAEGATMVRVGTAIFGRR